MGSPGSREAILAAQENIDRYLQHDNQHRPSEPGELRNTAPIWTHEIGNGNTDLIVQFHDRYEFRGAVNTMMRLIETHGIDELQRVGVVGQGSVPHMREMALAAGVYNIPVYSGTSAMNGLDDTTEAEATSTLDIGRLKLDAQLNVAPGTTSMSQSILFPSNDDIDAVHGQGTVAFQLERELSSRDLPDATNQNLNKRKPDIIISDLDSGITLSGICMAFAGTGTHVFGAAPEHGFYYHAWNSHTPGRVTTTQEDVGQRYWAGTKHPMAAIPWSTFTAPGYLTGICEVNNEQVHAAAILARDHYQLELQPDEAVPLAVALYNEDFQKFASKRTKSGRKRVVGVILRSRKEYHERT